ncbi:hypothetical protein RvY_01043 [Ramazzottius varieornatus]|uniref:G-protein coupled receptors family 2 profile 2 domain-containing protein n=1 Tax=Ramazzottius varieornatus TaxID=947166 RepID=A0A1D1UFA8_RAMVA|nr:hypothetical protein RvY_01043 [Ramazzottius varieornatus]
MERLLVFLTSLASFSSASGQVKFEGIKEVYDIQNLEPAETVVASFHATDLGDPGARLIYELYDVSDTLPFQMNRYSGKLLTTEDLNAQNGHIYEVSVMVSNLETADNARENIKLRIVTAANKHDPHFPSNGSDLHIPRNASTGDTVWVADATDQDPDEVNNAIVYELQSLSPPGFVEFTNGTGELKLLKEPEEISDTVVIMRVKACNAEEGLPVRCSIGQFNVMLEPLDFDAGSLIDSLNDITAEKLNALAGAVENMANVAKRDVKVAQSMVNIIGAVLTVEGEKLDAAMTLDSSKKLTNSVENYAKDAVMPADKSNLHIEANNVKINLLDVASDFQDTALQFSAADMAELQSSTNGTAAPDNLNLSFTIPKNVLMTGREGSASASPIRLSFVLYESTKLYKLSNETTAPPSKLNINCTTISLGDNPVIAATIRGANTDHLSEPVTFKLRKPTPNLEYRCVYWDPKRHRWSTKGVSVISQNDEEIKCQAHHMTAFSVLFDPTPDVGVAEEHKFALSLISYIGCGLSFFGCVATIITYSFFRHLHADRAGKILINLCVAIAFLNLCFVIGGLMPLISVDIPCAVMSTLIHFFSLASFVWMGIEAYNMYLLLIKVFFDPTTKNFILKRMLVGWGVPLLVSVSTALLETFNNEDVPYGTECRLTPHNTFVYYSAFLAPFACIILSNTIIFVMVVFVLCKPRPDFANSTKTKNEKRSVKGAQVHGTLAVMFLLGVTWIFGAMAISHARVLFQYVFCLTNSLQGFFVFIFRCLERQEARNSWMHFLKTGQRRPPPDSSRTTRSQMSSTRRNSMQKTSVSRSSSTDPACKRLLHPRSSKGNVPFGSTAFMVHDHSFNLIDTD